MLNVLMNGMMSYLSIGVAVGYILSQVLRGAL